MSDYWIGAAGLLHWCGTLQRTWSRRTERNNLQMKKISNILTSYSNKSQTQEQWTTLKHPSWQIDRGHIVGLHEAGWSDCTSALHVGGTCVTVAHWWSHWVHEGTHTHSDYSDSLGQTTLRLVVVCNKPYRTWWHNVQDLCLDGRSRWHPVSFCNMSLWLKSAGVHCLIFSLLPPELRWLHLKGCYN